MIEYLKDKNAILISVSRYAKNPKLREEVQIVISMQFALYPKSINQWQ